MRGYLERMRQGEIEAVRGWFKPGMRVLDVGGGNGYQASVIASFGCDVLSIDLADRPPSPKPFFPVQDYDGRNLPTAELKPDGLAIHVVPSAGWRFWTSVGHFGFAVKYLLGRRRAVPGLARPVSVGRTVRDRGLIHVIKRILPISSHGEYPNALAEIYYFSRRRWQRVFQSNGFYLIHVSGNNIFYSGYELLPALSLRERQRIARFLGSACHIFVMQPAHAGTFGHERDQ